MGRIIKWIRKCILWFFGISLGLVLVFRFLPIPFTSLMFIRTGQQFIKGNELKWKHDWVSLDEISDHLELAVICSEDQNFTKHFGFDMKAIQKAMDYNRKGQKIRGASTITQQTAKNVFLWPHRSWVRKGLEGYFTILIEVFWSKERIMEVYLNSIEMGPGIYGAEAASQYWFKKPASKLSRLESAAIAAILPSPLRYKAHPPSAYIQGRKQWVVRQMVLHGGEVNYQHKSKE
ncbi:monofunctional biosynthetic peptidoglycan transglycosylase [Imtechella halotolerans]|uniref:Biosynthetic peptidoglycan transglycosylase n=1 Tax=Imtechella halotolerans K1 TaxID=946077 RepID=I0WJK0_9FLAO|nr:monofunctional biosynthetic peptidoglycan transglycosylase [Imtechella halotolerans]EID76566.1 monofunctional biosynthetic peptidoglycan transglycosylase [Imtechella halotolerans K1]WMQ62863.1 monofunctional biosynthetic peptidoglycan transglycosylase [Imtechella halotolerans]